MRTHTGRCNGESLRGYVGLQPTPRCPPLLFVAGTHGASLFYVTAYYPNSSVWFTVRTFVRQFTARIRLTGLLYVLLFGCLLHELICLLRAFI